VRGYFNAVLVCSLALASPTSAGDLKILSRGAPKYPPEVVREAFASQLFAACLVEFDVLNSGSTAHPRACCRVTSERDPNYVADPGFINALARVNEEAIADQRYEPAPGDPNGVQAAHAAQMLLFSLHPLTPTDSLPLPKASDCFAGPIA
jgi:hypothetical protein